jgi:hypothetical protein
MKKQRVQTGVAAAISVGNIGQVKKGSFFLHGEVFFLLTGPLMGDPAVFLA